MISATKRLIISTQRLVSKSEYKRVFYTGNRTGHTD
uniref:Uncharacterized protein n=1 Tax=Arundo donax TaxID=35708 RepID=A0A0A9BA39_ARUDO